MAVHLVPPLPANAYNMLHTGKQLGVLLLLLISWQAHAQQDTVPTVVLEQVQVIRAARQPTQALLQFYKTTPAATLEEVLSRIPEMSLVRRGAYGMEPAVRSYSAGQINVLVDGMRIHGACTDKMDPASIYVEPINLSSIQLETGANAFAKGATLGGSIDMQLAKAVPGLAHAWQGSVSSGYQSAAQAWYHGGQLHYSGQRWAVRASGTFRKAQAYKDGDGNTVPFSQYNKVNATTAITYQLNQRTTLRADVLYDEGWNIGYPALPMDVGSAKALIAALSIEQTDAAAAWYSKAAKLYVNRIVHAMDDTQRPNVPMHMDMPGTSNTVGAYATALYRRQDHQLQLRADASATQLHASMTMYAPGSSPMYMLTWPDNQRWQTGAAAQWKWQADSNWQLLANIRTDVFVSRLTSILAKDHIAILNGNTNTRWDVLGNASLQVNRQLGKGHKVSASVGWAQRMPTASELYGFYLYNAAENYDYVGNTALKPEQSLQSEINYQYRGARWQMKISGFYHALHHYIVGEIDPQFSAMTIGSAGVKRYTQQSNAALMGAELWWQAALNKRWLWINTLRYQHGEVADSPMPFVSPLKAVSSMRWAWGKLSLQGECEIAAAQERPASRYGEVKTNGYTLLHLRLAYPVSLMGLQWQWQTGVENLLNESYRDHLDWGKTILRPGRNVYLQCTVKWSGNKPGH